MLSYSTIQSVIPACLPARVSASKCALAFLRIHNLGVSSQLFLFGHVKSVCLYSCVSCCRLVLHSWLAWGALQNTLLFQPGFFFSVSCSQGPINPDRLPDKQLSGNLINNCIFIRFKLQCKCVVTYTVPL